MKFVWVCGLGVVLGLLGGMVGAVDDSFALQAGGGVPLGSDSFVDVPVGHWADEEVGWAVSNGLMEGVGGGRFDLEGVVPRWQIVSALYGAFGLAGGKGEAGGVPLGSDSFVDVPVGHVADVEVGWAVSVGITQGVGGGRFDLDGSVTRAQIVTFLSRLSGLLGGPVDGGLGSDSFVDVPVGHWADEEVGWAVVNGVSRGVGGGRFDLDRVVSRAQIATLLFRVVRLVEESRVDVREETGNFTAVSAGYWHSCGLRADGTIVCWGRNSTWNVDYAGQADPPDGNFTAVTTGSWHSCGLRADGTIVCWGLNHRGQADPPYGNYTAVTTGEGHSCGLRADGTIVCWGSNYAGQADPPDGIFTAVSAGAAHSCGLRADGTIVCWGRKLR